MAQLSEKQHYIRRVILIVTGLLTVLPLAPVINRYLPPIMLGSVNLDLALSISLAALLTWLVLRLFRYFLLPAILFLVVVLFYNQFSNGYGFNSMISDYRTMVENNWGNNSKKEKNLVVTPSFFDGPLTKTVKALQAKVDYKDSVVRNFAVQHSLEYFDEYHIKYGPMVRLLSLFKHINSNFKYVSDSYRDEYFAGARETILNGLGGDCDDHTLLMVSCLKAIGGHVRMVLTEGHLYPELLAGDEKSFERMQQAIVHLFGNEAIDNMYYHEQNGQYWINLDYSAKYPGGPYVSEIAYAIIEL
ncbi:MAG: transglutaminase family protein [Chitinophagaceae bacterium]|nr:MAG: transglutaminase family protein [Chitinophagaceae bacterium]